MKNNIFGYHLQDSRNVKDTIKTKLVDVIITSPPYWNLKDYGIDNQIGFGQNYEKYLDELIDILNNCKDVLKDKGSMWIVVDSFKKGGNIRMLPFEIADRLQKKGWHLQDIIIWQKDKTLPWSSKGKLRNIFEYVLFFTKDNNFNFFVDNLREIDLKEWWPKYPERYNPKGKVPSRVWEIPIPVQGWGNSWVRHFCPFPPRLVENILLLTTLKDGVVLDPFAGSGSVLAQAKVMGRNYIGFDLNKNYKKMFDKKVLPFFDEIWQERRIELENINKKREYLEKTILALRKLKLPLCLHKQINSSGSKQLDLKLRGVLILDGGKKSHSVDYTFFFSNSKGKKEYLEQELKSPELSKFSLDATISVKDIAEFHKIIASLNEDLYVYRKGVFNHPFCKLENPTLLNEENKYPLLVSNIYVNQKNHIL